MQSKKVNRMVWIDLLERTGVRTGSLFLCLSPMAGRDPRKVLFALAGVGLPIFRRDYGKKD